MVIKMIIKTHGYTISYVDKPNLVNGPILSVTRAHMGGKCLQGNLAREWMKAIKTAIDAKEQAAL